MNGRPTATDSRQRQARFLCLVASGIDAETAAREARLSPWKALRIVTESDYRDVVAAIKEGAGPLVAVIEAGDPPAAQAA